MKIPIKPIGMNIFVLAMLYGLSTEMATLCAGLLAGTIGYELGKMKERSENLRRQGERVEAHRQAMMTPQQRIDEKRELIRRQIIEKLPMEEKVVFMVRVLDPASPLYDEQEAIYQRVEAEVDRRMAAGG